MAGSGELVFNLGIDAKVDQVVDQQFSNQKLSRDVVELFLAIVEWAGSRALLHELDQQFVNAAVIELLE